jgi:hypothetical protein
MQDVVEIRNISHSSVSTAGWYLSDGSDPYGCPLPEQTLASGDFLVIPISRGTAGFGLSEGETVYLIGPDHLWSQPVSCVPPEGGSSISLVDGSQPLSYELAEPSLGYVNHTAGVEAFAADQLQSDLRISEVMSSNSSYLVGPYGNTTDWVGLYNGGKDTIDLSKYCLSDSPDGAGYPLPDKKLAPGSYTVILLSESGKRLKSGYAWLPFSLAAAGDRLYLTENGEILDYTVLPEMSGDEAWGRPAGSMSFSRLSSPTPGGGNGGKARISAEPVASLAQGAYDGVESLTISFSAKGEIYYTTDCTAPTKSDKKYTKPITIMMKVLSKGENSFEIERLSTVKNEADMIATSRYSMPDRLMTPSPV